MVSVAAPADGAVTANSRAAPTALVVLQKPVPEKPAQLESIVPLHVPLSASNRLPGGGRLVTSKSRKSRLAGPSALVPVSRIVLLPALTVAVMVAVAQVLHAPVGLNASPVRTTAPFTEMSAARFVVPPLAYRKASVAVPLFAALTVHWTNWPAALAQLTKPVPEKPAWLDSTRHDELVAVS